MTSKDGDWRTFRKSGYWEYTGLDDPKYIKDRDELFAEGGNGWWWFTGVKYTESQMEIIRKRRNKVCVSPKTNS